MRRLFAVLALAAAVACGGDSPTNPASASLAGTYSLRTVNGNPLPYAFQIGSSSAMLTSDVITVASGGTWSEVYSYDETQGGSTTTQTGSASGAYVRSGTSVGFLNGDGTTAYSGTFSGNSLNLSDGTWAQVFTK